MQDERIKALLEAIDASPGFPEQAPLPPVFVWQSFSWNFQLFKGNFLDLMRLLGIFASPQAHRFLAPGAQQEHTFQEITRLLHNFVASAMSLFGRSRTLIASQAPSFLEEYTTEVNKMVENNAHHQIALGLRHYILHIGLPYISVTRCLRVPDDYSCTFTVSARELLLWKNWKTLAKGQLKQVPSLDIGEFAERYYQDVASFHDWVLKRGPECLREGKERQPKK